MEQKPTTVTINLHDKQMDVIEFKQQFCAAIAGVRGGKTYVGSVWAAKKIAECDGHGIITAPTYKMLEQATLPTFFGLFPSYRKYYKSQKSVIEFPPDEKGFVKTIFIRSMEDPTTLSGITADWCWGDEAGLFPILGWHELRSRVSLVKGQILFTTTPYSMGWLWTDFVLPFRGGDPDLLVVHWKTIENPYFPPEVYEAEKKRLRPEEFKRRYEGDFTRMEGLVYDLKNWNIVEPNDKLGEFVIGGVDWGFNNPTAITVIKVMRDGVFEVVDEWYETGKTTADAIRVMQGFKATYGVRQWFADSAEPDRILDCNTNTGLYVIGYKKGKDSISQGVSTLQQLILENRLLVWRGLVNTLAEFNAYHYPEEKADGKVFDEPYPQDNHLMDAIRYAIMGHSPQMRTYIPPLQGTYTEDRLRRLLTGGKSNNYGNKTTGDTQYR